MTIARKPSEFINEVEMLKRGYESHVCPWCVEAFVPARSNPAAAGSWVGMEILTVVPKFRCLPCTLVVVAVCEAGKLTLEEHPDGHIVKRAAEVEQMMITEFCRRILLQKLIDYQSAAHLSLREREDRVSTVLSALRRFGSV